MDDEYRSRKHDHLVEPFFSGLGAEERGEGDEAELELEAELDVEVSGRDASGWFVWRWIRRVTLRRKGG